MSLDRFIQDINENYPYWGLWASGAALAAGYLIAKIQNYSSTKSPYELQTLGQEIPKESHNQEYTQRTINTAMLPDVESRISGVITEFHNSLRVYSGKIKDNTGQCPFYMDTENIAYIEDQGLVPILLHNSLKNGILVEMDVTFIENIFKVKLLKHKMDDQEYVITQDETQDDEDDE